MAQNPGPIPWWRRRAATIVPDAASLDDEGVLLALAASYRLALEREGTAIETAPGLREEMAAELAVLEVEIAERGLGERLVALVAAMAAGPAPRRRTERPN